MRIFNTVIPRNAALLITLLILIAVAPLLTTEGSYLVVELLFDAILISGVYSTERSRQHRAFLLLTIVTLGVRWGDLLSGYRGLDLASLVLMVIWLFYALAIIVRHLFRQRDVTADTILGAIVAYLLAAVAFANLYQIIELQNPGSFSGFPDDIHEVPHGLSMATLYFSFVCITTMGYGDIVAASAAVRPLTVLEGVFGQFYLAVMIARLVGLHLARDQE